MSEQYDNRNTGIISKNERKEKDSHPDITGTINVEGKEFWISGWHKTRKDGKGVFYSLSVKPKEDRQPARQETSNNSRRPASTSRDDLDSIPF